MRQEVLRYLVCGAAAALITLGVRVLFSLALPFGAATLCAQLVGMVSGFYLYRRFVWVNSTRPVRETIAPFVAVNLASVVVVLAVSLGVRMLLIRLFGVTQIGDLFAHATGIVCGAALSMVGHRTFTFR